MLLLIYRKYMFITMRWVAVFMICIYRYRCLQAVSTLQMLHKQLQQQIQQPKQTITKIPLSSFICPQGQKISIALPETNFEITSQVYVHAGALDDDRLFNKKAYQTQKVCKIFPTNIQTKSRADTKFDEDMEVFNHYLSHKEEDKKSTLYILSANATLYKYIIDKINIKQSGKYQITSLESLMQDSRLSTNIQMLQIGSTLFVFSPQFAHILDEKNIINHFANVNGYQAVNRIVNAGIISDKQSAQGKVIWVCGGNVIYVYSVNILSDNNFYLNQINKIQGFTNQTILSITYNHNDKYFYLTSGTTMYIINSTKNSISPIQAYNINTQCQKISLIDNVLYLGCKYERVNFIQELILKPKVVRGEADRYPYEDIKINRYYDDYLLDGVRDVEQLGNNRIALIGDQEAIIIGQAVNRNILLGLEQNKNKQQFYQRVYSLGMIQFFYLSQFSTDQQSRILVLSQDKLSLLTVYYNPPQIQCKFSRNNFGSLATVLVSITKTCPQQSSVQQIPTYRMCESLYPYQIAIGEKQYQMTTSLVILVSFLIVGVSLIMVCIGYGIKLRKKADIIIQKLRRKLEKKKKFKQLKESRNTIHSI